MDPGIQQVLDAMNALEGPPAHEVPIEQARAGHEQETEQLSGPGDPVAEVQELRVPAAGAVVPVRVYRPDGQGSLPVVAYFHGGGWAVGSIDSFDAVCRALANASGAVVASVGYRLAPEHPFPAALEGCVAVTRWLGVGGPELGADPTPGGGAGGRGGGDPGLGGA